MKKWKILWIACFAMMLVLGACSSGDSGNTPASDTPAESSQTTTEPEVAEPITISLVNYGGPTSVTPQQTYIEQRFNVKLDYTSFDSASYGEQFSVRVASGDVPDLFYVSNPAEFAKQGVLMELPIELLREKLPEYTESADKLNPMILTQRLIDDKNYFIPSYYAIGATPLLAAWNMGMLAEIGYSEIPKHIDEVEEALIKLKEHFPESYAYAPRANAALEQAFMSVYGAYQVLPFGWNLIDGEIVHGAVSDRTREALGRLHKWYELGLIDPEFPTYDYTIHMSKFANRQVVITEHNLHWYPIWSEEVKALKEKFGDEVKMSLPYAGPYGPGKNMAFGGFSVAIGIGSHVAKDEAKLNKIFEILRAITSEDEAYLGAAFGEEGVTYQFDEDGKPVYLVEGAGDGGNQTGNFFTMFLRTVDFENKYVNSVALQEANEQFLLDHPDLDAIRLVNAVPVTLPSQAEYSELRSFLDQAVLGFITGTKNLETEWDSFVSEYNNRGGRVLTAEANEWYQNNK